MIKKFLAAGCIVAGVAATPFAATAQTAGELAQLRAACSVGQGNCLAFIQGFVANPAFVGLSATAKAGVVGTLALELRNIGVSVQDDLVDLDIEDSLEELIAITPEGEQSEQLSAIIAEVLADTTEDGVPIASFSVN